MKKAFTLAEILISMTIIGVISLLMIPVMQNTQLKSLETATAHFYSMMSQAIKQYMVDNDTTKLPSTPMYLDYSVQNWQTEEENAYKEVDNFVYKYLKVKKMCEYTNSTDCFSKTVYNLDGRSGEYILAGSNIQKVYVLDNGSTFTIIPPTDGYPARIQVDINGKKGPNIAGRDIWAMSVYADGVISENIHTYQMSNYFRKHPEIMNQNIKNTVSWRFENCYGDNDGSNNWGIWTYGAGCFARFEYNGFKFDY